MHAVSNIKGVCWVDSNLSSKCADDFWPDGIHRATLTRCLFSFTSLITCGSLNDTWNIILWYVSYSYSVQLLCSLVWRLFVCFPDFQKHVDWFLCHVWFVSFWLFFRKRWSWITYQVELLEIEGNCIGLYYFRINNLKHIVYGESLNITGTVMFWYNQRSRKNPTFAWGRIDEIFW